ncbi:MAG: hypothetical protein GOV00_03245 [Candidatus Altiarchaeota archaeon]|nr:hypothetical protein [Candidatus Altiarchaeota archaeon]
MGTPDWLKAVKEGRETLDVFYLAGMREGATRLRPPVNCARGHIQKVWYDMVEMGGRLRGLDPPHQPMAIAIEGNNLSTEDVLRSWMDTFPGVGGLKLTPIKLFETFSYSEASQMHGNMLQKESFQKNQAKELLATIQNIKTAILNIETDLEKLDEQITAFKSGDWEQVKWLFIDNYGGPDRSWTSVARQVPLVRLSMTWFLRLKTKNLAPFGKYMKIQVDAPSDKRELERLEKQIRSVSATNKKDHIAQIDALVKEEQINPAIANHLKSKVEEFWNWISHYSSWLKKSKDRVLKNMIYQKTNLKMYMKWAADAIGNAERLKMESTNMENAIPDFAFKHTPREMTSMGYIFAADEGRPEILERCKPWVPVILTHIDVVSTVELQNKFAGISFFNMNGYIKRDDLKAITDYLNHGSSNLVNTMIRSGAMSEDEITKIFDSEELKVLVGESGGKFKFDAVEKKRMFQMKLWDSLLSSMKVFGITGYEQDVDWTYSSRAAGYAYELMLRGLEMFKKANHCFTYG